MAALTKSQLLSELESLRVEHQRVVALNESLTSDISGYVERLNKAKAVYRDMAARLDAATKSRNSGVWRQRVVAPREETESHRAYVAQCEAAKRAAAESGKAVLV